MARLDELRRSRMAIVTEWRVPAALTTEVLLAAVHKNMN